MSENKQAPAKKESTQTSKIAFVISPIGKPESPERKRSNQILNHIIKPVTTELGYSTLRADDINEPGIITKQIVDHILNDPLVIADLTDHNPNVMYELSLRHAIRKPVVQLICENQLPPFDISANRTILFDHRDLDSAAQTKVMLKKFIEEVIKDPSLVDSPISTAITFENMKQTGNPMTDALSGLSEMMSSVSKGLNRIEQQMIDISNSSNKASESSSKFVFTPSSSVISPSVITDWNPYAPNKKIIYKDGQIFFVDQEEKK